MESLLKLIRRIIIFQIFLWFACGMECNICISVFSSILKKFKKKVWNIITLIHYGKLEWGNDIFQLFIHPLKHLGWETCPSTGWQFNKMKFLRMGPALIRGNPSWTCMPIHLYYSQCLVEPPGWKIPKHVHSWNEIPVYVLKDQLQCVSYN